MTTLPFRTSTAAALLFTLVGCGDADEPTAAPAREGDVETSAGVQGDAHEEAQEGGSALVDVPPDIAANLGIGFAEVQRRAVRDTLRVPGHVEVLPEAVREHHVVVEGRVTLLVHQFQAVRIGDPLLEIVSPEFRRLQHETVEAQGEIQVARAMLDVARARQEETEREISVLDERIGALRRAGSRNAQVEAERALAETRRPRLEAERLAAEVRLAEAREHLRSRTRLLGAVTGLTTEALLDETTPDGEDEPVPFYRTIHVLTVRSEIDGVVDRVVATNGAWLRTGDLALTLVQPDALRFVGDAPVHELPTHAIEDRAVRLVPPRAAGGAPGDAEEAWHGTFVRAPVADSRTRTARIVLTLAPGDRPAWIRAGVPAFVEIDRRPASDTSDVGVAIPKSALVRDGLRTFYYLRQADDPDHLHEIEAQLGADDGWWVELIGGPEPGREVVSEGAGTLYLATGGGGRKKAPPGFHYHADGSLHADH